MFHGVHVWLFSIGSCTHAVFWARARVNRLGRSPRRRCKRVCGISGALDTVSFVLMMENQGCGLSPSPLSYYCRSAWPSCHEPSFSATGGIEPVSSRLFGVKNGRVRIGCRCRYLETLTYKQQKTSLHVVDDGAREPRARESKNTTALCHKKFSRFPELSERTTYKP